MVVYNCLCKDDIEKSGIAFAERLNISSHFKLKCSTIRLQSKDLAGKVWGLLHKDLCQLKKTKSKPETKGAPSVGKEGGQAEPYKICLDHLHAIPEPDLEKKSGEWI